MERVGKIIDYLSEDDLVFINHYLVIKHGGFYSNISRNIINPSSFNYVLEAVKTTIYDRELCDSIFKKAAMYASKIIKDHIFYDGNKRTGCAAAFVFLSYNGININVNNDEVVDLGLRIENSSLDMDEIAVWLEMHSKET